MCNLSQGIRQKAYAEGYAESYAEGRFEVRLESIRALIETVGASSGQAMDLLKIKEQDRPEALTRIQSSLVLEQIAKEENIEVSDADVDAEIEKMAKNYGMEADKLKEYMGEGEKESMKRELAITKEVDLIMDNMK